MERRERLSKKFVEKVAIFPDQLEVTVSGSPRLSVILSEVGLSVAQSEMLRVGGGTRHNGVRALDAYRAWSSSHVGAKIDGNPVREVGSTELWLPAA
jgi:hypothetical protein